MLLCSACLAGAALAGSRTARAQAIDQYLNPDIPGFAAEPGVTVASRAHPEYDAQGIRVGTFLLHPTLTESVGYDDNVFGTPQAHGSALIETDAAVTATSTWATDSLGFSATVDDSEYPSESQQSFTTWSVAAGGSHDFGQDTLYIGATHLNLNQTPRDLDAPALDSPIAYRVDDVRADYKIDLGRAFLLPGMDVSFFSFDNGSVLGTPYIQDYRNRTVYSPSLTGSYELATRRRIVVVLKDSQADFDHAPPGNPRETFNDFSILGGLAYDADGIIGFRVLGGYEERSFSSSLYKMIQAPILESSISWTPSGLTTVTATAARYIEDSAAEATIGYTESTLKLNLDHEYSRSILLNAHGAFYNDDYSQGGGSQNFYSAGLGATYRINRNLRLVADYTFNGRHTSTGGVPNTILPFGSVFGGNYSENVFTIQVRVGL